MLVLNIILAMAVVAVLLGLLSWAIISSRRDPLLVKADIRQPAAAPPSGHRRYAPHPHWPGGHWPQQGARRSVSGRPVSD